MAINNFKLGIILGILFCIGLLGCDKLKQDNSQEKINAQMDEVIHKSEDIRDPYKGTLTPEKAAKVSHEISLLSIEEFSPEREIPEDPKVLSDINKQMSSKQQDIYSKYGTSEEDFSKYLTSLSPQDREKYHAKLTKMFLAHGTKKNKQNAENTKSAQEKKE